MDAWIGLGSNTGKPEKQLTAAIQCLDRIHDITLKRCSSYYRTAPWGVEEQEDFVNAVLVVDSQLQPHDLLRVLLDIEGEMGRERGANRWGPRCIDLDLLTYNDLVMKSPGLELPHPRMHLRAFVLRPVLELDPDFVIPGMGPAASYFSSLEPQGVEYLGPAGWSPDKQDK